MKNEDQVRCEFNESTFYIPKKIFSQCVLKTQYPEKKFIRYKDGPKIYGMSEREFYKIAHDAGAVYKLNKLALIKVEIIDRYLECFKE